MTKLFDPVALGLEVARVGGNEVLVRCPYHDDSHPSGYFNTKRGLFYCFSCGASKNVVQIAKDLGGEVRKTTFIDTETADTVLQVLDWATFLRAPLATGNPYLASRQVSDDAVRRFDIRELPNAVVFLIRNHQDEVVGAQMRMVEGKRYMLIGQRTPLWPSSVLYQDFDPRDPNLFVVEGVFGAIRAWEHGVRAVATLGASSTAEASVSLKSFDRFKILFDDDFAGYVGAAKLCLASHLRGSVILPGDEADEMAASEWAAATANPGSVDFEKMALMSGDKAKFNALVWR